MENRAVKMGCGFVFVFTYQFIRMPEEHIMKKSLGCSAQGKYNQEKKGKAFLYGVRGAHVLYFFPAAAIPLPVPQR